MSKKSEKDNIKNHIEVIKEMNSIPSDLRAIFCPSTYKGLCQYLGNIINWKRNSINRRKAYDMWKAYKDELPLKSRKYSLRRIKIITDIIWAKSKRKYRDGYSGLKDDDDI